MCEASNIVWGPGAHRRRLRKHSIHFYVNHLCVQIAVTFLEFFKKISKIHWNFAKMCTKWVFSFQKRPWRIRRLVQHCMGVRGKLNRSCPCPTLHTVHFCNIVWGRGERKKFLIIFFEKTFFFKKLHFHFFSAHFPGNSSKQIRSSGCRKFRRVATAVGISPCC